MKEPFRIESFFRILMLAGVAFGAVVPAQGARAPYLAIQTVEIHGTAAAASESPTTTAAGRPAVAELAAASASDTRASGPVPENETDPSSRSALPDLSLLAHPAPSGMAARSGLPAGAYREHAPLAWFSMGSLAVGGVFYAIGHNLEKPNVSYVAGDRFRMSSAVAAAGLTALIAAGSYVYFARRDRSEDSWDAAVSGGTDGAGGLSLGARLTFALPGIR